MFTRLMLGSALCLGSLAIGLAPTPSKSDATITPGPRIELLKKQNDAQYIGWVSWDGDWSSDQCGDGFTYYQTSNYWRCCTTTDDGCAATNIAIGCISGSLIYPESEASQLTSLGTYACTDLFSDPADTSFTVCNTIFMYEDDDDSDALTNINCGVSSLNWSYYRVRPTDDVTSSTISPSPSPSPPSTPALSTSTTTPSLPTVTPGPDPKKKESKAWIAGVVVGPIIGLAIIGLAAFLFMRRKKNKQAQTHTGAGGPSPAAPAAFSQPSYPNSPPQYHQSPMQQYAAAPGVVPFGASKESSWAAPQSPIPQIPYGIPPQQGWQGQNNSQISQTAPMGGQSVYGAPSPSLSSQPGQYGGESGTYKHTGEMVRPFSSELEGSHTGHAQPEYIGVQPRHEQ